MRPYTSGSESVLNNSTVFPFVVTNGPVAAAASIPPPSEAPKLGFSVDLAVRMIDDPNGNARWVSAERMASVQFSRYQPPPHAASRPWRALWQAEMASRYAKFQAEQQRREVEEDATAVTNENIDTVTTDKDRDEPRIVTDQAAPSSSEKTSAHTQRAGPIDFSATAGSEIAAGAFTFTAGSRPVFDDPRNSQASRPVVATTSATRLAGGAATGRRRVRKNPPQVFKLGRGPIEEDSTERVSRPGQGTGTASMGPQVGAARQGTSPAVTPSAGRYMHSFGLVMEDVTEEMSPDEMFVYDSDE